MTRWYDPISEVWLDMPEPAPPGRIEPHRPAGISAEHARIWEAVEASAAASCIIGSHQQEHQNESGPDRNHLP